MKKILAVISSTRTTALLLLVFGISIAAATFIENDFGTRAARSVVYNASWFELLMAAGVVNIIAVTIAGKMYRRSKLTMLVFHLAFVVIIIGAAITRFTGTEGAMYIREGETSDSFLTSDTYLTVGLAGDHDPVYYSQPVLFSDIARNHFNKGFMVDGKSVRIQLTGFYEKAERVLRSDSLGQPHAIIVLAGQSGRRNMILAPGDEFELGHATARFLDTTGRFSPGEQVRFFTDKQGSLVFTSPFPVIRTAMMTQTIDTLAAGVTHEFRPMSLHYFNGSPVVLSQFMENSRVEWQQVSDKNARLPSVLNLEVSTDSSRQSLVVEGASGEPGSPASTSVSGKAVSVRYGSVLKKLPFAIHLDDFIIDRYPGSGSPSWFESRVHLIDNGSGTTEARRIYMNNILNYRGYRLYQSSYDQDELGSVLAVNHDGTGTLVTYAGYLMLAIGFILSLINRNSRFLRLWKSTGSAGKSAGLIIMVFTLASPNQSLKAQSQVTRSEDRLALETPTNSGMYDLPYIDESLAGEFDTVLVQDANGRIEPMNTLSSEILRKVVRKESYHGLNGSQVILGMISYPGFWLKEPMIRIGHPEIKRRLGITGNYASFNDFFGDADYNNYIFSADVEAAYRKQPAYRSKYDNELIRADERLNICSMIYSQRAFRIFPNAGDETHTWYSPVTADGVFMDSDSVFAKHLIDYLVIEIRKAGSAHDWSVPVQLVKTLKTYQKNNAAEVLPPARRVKAEIFYNNFNFFGLLMKAYMLTGFLLLFFQVLYIFIPRFNLKLITIPAFIILLAAFTLHLAGLVLRWYVSGHAPWSNGFEALTFIAWATVLSGLIFSRKSGITLSATAILASLILMVAHLSWMDPQITNLVPVLKSYWLVIHVAVITASYGFLGLGALLATINLLLMTFQTGKNSLNLEPSILRVTQIIEMTLIVGLYMLTIGTFLGGVWANESWGRYWGWDPKETWALITVVVYAVILHLRLIPGLKGKVLFNILALAGFSSVIMTYFGVNYYLSGLHSYARGDPMPVPPVIYYSLAMVTLLSVLAAWNQSRLAGQNK